MLNPDTALARWRPVERLVVALAQPQGVDRKPMPRPSIARQLSRGTSAVIVGYGPIGQMVYRILRQNGIEPTVIE